MERGSRDFGLAPCDGLCDTLAGVEACAVHPRHYIFLGRKLLQSEQATPGQPHCDLQLISAV